MNAALAVGDGEGVGSGQCLKAVNLLHRVFCPSQGTAATTGHRAAVEQTRSRFPPLPCGPQGRVWENWRQQLCEKWQVKVSARWLGR